MARGYSASFLSAIASDPWYPAIFAKLDLGATSVNLWTGSSNFTFESETYVGAGHLLSISGIGEGPLQARNVSLSLSGQGSGIYQQLQTNNPKNRPVWIWVAAMADTDLSALKAVDSYALITKVYVSRPVLSDGPDGWSVTLECETEFSRLFRPVGRFLSHIDQQTRWPDDTFLRFQNTLPGRAIPWGGPATSAGGGGGANGGTGGSGGGWWTQRGSGYG